MPLTTSKIARGARATRDTRSGSREAYASVATTLRAMILDGDLEAGERLPGESQLCTLFSVSRSTIREAIRALASEHLLVIVRGAGGGTFVAHPTIDNVADSLTAMFHMVAGSDQCTFDELTEVRVLLETHAARRAATERRPEHLEALRAALIPARATRRTATPTFDANYAFHAAVVSAAQNHVVHALTMPIFSTLHHRVRRDARRFPTQRIVREHRAIAGAIEGGDPTRASALMQEHLLGLVPVYSALERTV